MNITSSTKAHSKPVNHIPLRFFVLFFLRKRSTISLVHHLPQYPPASRKPHLPPPPPPRSRREAHPLNNNWNTDNNAHKHSVFRNNSRSGIICFTGAGMYYTFVLSSSDFQIRFISIHLRSCVSRGVIVVHKLLERKRRAAAAAAAGIAEGKKKEVDMYV